MIAWSITAVVLIGLSCLATDRGVRDFATLSLVIFLVGTVVLSLIG